MQEQSRRQRFIIPFDEAPFDLGDMAKAFFFYPRGLMDAIEILLHISSVPDEIQGWQSNQIVADLEQFLEKEHRVKALPLDLNGLFTNVQCAVEMLDNYILNHLTSYFGATQIVVVDATPLPGHQLHYDVTVEFHTHPSVY